MKRCKSLWPALVSIAFATATLSGARPHYGGVLRVEAADETIARERALPMVYETLTQFEPGHGAQPLLARTFSSANGGSRWRFELRAGVSLHDGSTLEPWQVATALRAVERTWRIAADDTAVVIDLPDTTPDLPARLADQRYAVSVKRGAEQALGTGPFAMERADARSWTLRAHDGHRNGRPFLDRIEIAIGHSVAEQLAGLEAGRADVVAIQPTDARRVTQRGGSVFASMPGDLVAVLFEPHRATDAIAATRSAFAAAIQREAIARVLLQQLASPAAGLVPAWRSNEPGRAQSTLSVPPRTAGVERELTIRVDANDPLLRSVAERVAADTREAGITVRVQPATGLSPRADARLVFLPKVTRPPTRVESEQLDAFVLVPIVHVAQAYGASERVGTWNGPAVLPDGAWNFADLWLRNSRP